MRSIHKKTLKRFLSTLLALTMVLGMVPFTASAAAPADVTLTQSGLTATITPSVPAVTAGNTSTVTYDVTIEATDATADGKAVSLIIGPSDNYTSYGFGTVAISGSPSEITSTLGMPSGFTLSGGKITGTVTKDYAIGSHTVPMSLSVSGEGTDTDSATFTVDQKADLTVTAPTGTITAGENFTVTATSDVAEGYVKFTYGADVQHVAVIPDENGDGIASATFTATETAGTQTVTALQYAMTSVVNTEKTANITVNAIPVYHTITFLPGAVGAYIPFSPTTVSVKADGSYTIPAAIPTREGYTFKGWDSDGNAATVEYPYDSGAYTTPSVTPAADVILNAVWEQNATYTVTYSSGVPGVVTGMPDSISGIAAGSSYIISNAEPTCAGYTFQGWDSDNDAAADKNPGDVITVTGDVTLKAVWTEDKVAVTYPADVTGADVSKTTNTIVTENVTKGSTQTFTVTVTAGYDPATMKVTATVVSGSTYTYKFVADVDTVIDVVAPSVLKYTITLPTGEHFTANFTAPSEAAGKGSYTFDYGTTTAEFTVQLKDGYTGKVYIDGVAQPEIAKNGTGTYTLHATGGGIKHVCDIRVETAKVQTFTVTYTIDGQAYTTRTVDAGTAVNTLSNIAVPAKTGYTFGGWYSDTGLTTALDNTADTEKVTGDMEVYGKWTPVEGKIQYNLNSGSGSFADQTKFYGQALQLHPDIPTREGYTFKGWATVDGGAAVYQPGDMYSTEIGTSTVTLYAVWEQITFTVTLPSGTGYTVSSNQSTTVEWDKDFAFTITVDRAYAATKPTVKVNGNDVTADITGTTETSKEATWSYTIKNIKEDKVVSITVVMNQTYTVTLAYDTTDDNATYENKTFRTLEVEHGYKVTQPEAPSVPGYEFVGWMDSTKADTYDFSTPVTAPTIIYAQMKPIVPKVTWTNEADDGWNIDVTNATLVGETALNVSPNAVAYGSDMTFTITVDEGWDASKMQVAANGAALSAVEIDTTTSAPAVVYKYLLSNITADTTITVVGVVRKTVTITYNANARDDVSGMPEQQVVKYYLSDTDCDKLSALEPVRTGYKFLGWNTDPAATTATHVAGANANFKTDTTLYAIWEANSTSITLDVSDVAVAASGTANAKEYEGQKVTLTATLSPAVSTGSVNFYQNGKLLISVPANGSDTYTATAVTSPYKLDGTPVEDSYQVEYKAEGDEGYGSADKTTAVKVTVLSTTITWVLNASKKVDDTDKLTIYIGEGTSGSTTDQMEANNVYTLKIPVVKDLNDKTLTADKDYIVEWIYKDDKGVEREYTDAATGDYAVISAEYSKYQFRAVVTPVKDATRSVYNKAAGYDAGVLNNDDAPALYSQWTVAVAREKTETALAIEGAVNEDQKITIDGTEVDFGAAHWAQFEGDKLVLKASVTIKGETAPVSAGYVDFYRYNTDGTWTKLNADPVAVDENTGIATFGDDYNEAVLVKAYVDGTGSNADEAKDNVDKFFAVYLANATWETSASTDVTYISGAIDTVTAPAGDDVVYVKSTTIKTPVIDVKRGATEKGNTTYTTDLTGLIAGVEYTLTLREDGANTTDMADWSVVALDGRTVAKTDYTIQWYTGTPTTDPAKVDLTMGTGATYSVENPAKDDYFYVELTAQNNMDKGEKSNKVIIDAKQDVNVSVVASDEIKSTAETDVYQLNMITLTATVTAKEDDAAEQPTDGLVGFYYQPYSGAKWVKIGESKALTTEDGKTFAEIKTNVLPVDAAKNTKQTVKVLAVYEGNDTFNASHEVASDNSVSKKTTGTVEIEEVTVYSSVVYVNSTVENKANNTVGQDHTSGIYIYAEDGKILANETNVNLKLSDVYTLDHNIDLSKLAYGVDYTVQWQKLVNAASYSSVYAAADTPWVNIDGATNTTCQITVEQGAAYRAVITVKDTPIAKGSYTFVDQGTLNTVDNNDGRQVYYSNILVANPAPPTVTVNVNTSNTTDGYEGIVEGETVTIHTFASGASGTTPISELTMTITDASGAEVDKQVKTNVNGHVSFDWTAAKPGYYELKVVAKFTNGYSEKEITRTLIVRDKAYDFTAAGDNTTYNGKVQGLTVTVNNMGIESDLAQKSVVVYYYTDANRTQQVEPTQAGTYYATIRLQESAYWTEMTEETTFTIEKRAVEIDDVIVQAKVYNGSDSANVQEIILKDAETYQDSTGLPKNNTGVINGDSVYAIGTAKTDSANVNEATQVTVTVTELLGNDAGNYKLVDATYSEAFTIQRSQVKGDIADSTFQYTGSNITVPADDIYLIDQAGNKLSNYTVTYYYHNGDGVEKVDAMNKLGKYTVIARPDQTNYKGGASETVYVVSGTGTDADPTTPTSLTIDITDTVVLYTGTQVGVTAKDSKGNTITDITYNGSATIPTAAGRYLVKVTASTGDTAYGIYTIVKARPVLALSATGAEYTSAQISGTPELTYNGSTTFPAGTYYTYTGGTIQGVAYEAPTEVGTYIVTAHVPETDNYTAHEISYQFVITPKALKITADSLQRRQYGAFPDMTASFDGLADSAYAPDTSLRDVQIQPELIFNETDGYDNIAMDHVGNEYPIIAIAALARNYDVSYVNGNLSVTRDEPNPYLAIHGMIDNGNGGDIAYYGDVIQLYAYGSQMGNVINNSSVLTWSSSDNTKFPVTQDGLLTINGVGTFTVTLTRGVGAQKISTSINITALKQEVKVVVPELNTVYNATSQDYTTTKTMSAVNAKGVQVFEGNSRFVINGNIRTDVGSQIVTGKVADSIQSFQSETYGGLFTINDKEVTVKPTAATTTYGTKASGLTYSITPTGSDAALSNGKAVSVTDLYGNLDVYDGYEILVAGTENQNYNVKYLTNPGAEKVTVDPLALTVSTGTLNNNVGMTSGSMNPVGKFPVNGAEVTGTTLGNSNVRMYGEPNWVMDYALATLVDGDSLADLATLPEWLVKFDYTKLHNIAEDANLQYPAPQSLMTDKSNYSIDSSMSFGNYNVSKDNGTQNIYQRPVTLKLSNSQTSLDIYFAEILTSGGAINTDKLRNIIINNVEAGKYNNEGGLAELLKHTVKDLNLKVTISGYTGSPDTQFTATVTVGNPNYWLGNADQKFDITVNILPQRLTVDYTTFTATFSDVVLYQQSETTCVAAYATGDVTFKIYRYVDGKENYSYYAANEATVFSGTMTKDMSRTGRYYVTYPKLSAGTYRVFAVASGYTIID